jgi:hypothetical protein
MKKFFGVSKEDAKCTMLCGCLAHRPYTPALFKSTKNPIERLRFFDESYVLKREGAALIVV